MPEPKSRRRQAEVRGSRAERQEPGRGAKTGRKAGGSGFCTLSPTAVEGRRQGAGPGANVEDGKGQTKSLPPIQSQHEIPRELGRKRRPAAIRSIQTTDSRRRQFARLSQSRVSSIKDAENSKTGPMRARGRRSRPNPRAALRKGLHPPRAYPVFCRPAETPVTVARMSARYSAFSSSERSSRRVRTTRKARTCAIDSAST